MEKNRRSPDLGGLLDHGDVGAVRAFAEATLGLAYPGASFPALDTAYPLVKDLFEGRFPGYASCRTGYHDYRHTADVFVAAVRLVDGGALSGRPLPADLAEDLLAAALLHDCGYIQEEGDQEGTGARYTRTHVARSAGFVRSRFRTFGLEQGRAERIARLILGTDFSHGLAAASFSDEAERTAAATLAAADLLGQMADRAYLEKLLFLYYEFREAGIGGYGTAFDILKNTASFYRVVSERLDGPLGAVSRDAKAHFAVRAGTDRDLYREAIERHMAYLDGILRDDSVNFRKRLRRIDLEKAEREEKSRLEAFGAALG